jgi:inhibitor of KinA
MGKLSVHIMSEKSLLFQVDSTLNTALSTEIALLKKALESYFEFEKVNYIVSYTSILVLFNETIPITPNTSAQTWLETVCEKVNMLMNNGANCDTIARLIKIPVWYNGLDLSTIASEKGLSVEKIIELHTQTNYHVYSIGFKPGFAYMGFVNEQISSARHTQPRLNVEAGSVGIAGNQTGIYPEDSPGGWKILGKTPLRVFDATLANPCLLQNGDQVQFYAITELDYWAKNEH